MGRKGVGAFTSQNTVLQNNVIAINVPKAIDKTNFNTDADQINYQSRFVAQPIYCHESAGDYIAIDDTDAQVTTAWASLSVEESGDVLTSTALVPAFSTDMKIQLEVRAVDDTETLYSKVITTIDMFAIKNDSADFIVNNISWKNNNVTVKAQVKDSGLSLPANVDEIRGEGTLTAAFNTWRYDLATIFGDINYKLFYSIKETDFPYPNTLANNFNLRTWDWVNDGIEFTLNDLNQKNNYQIKLILDRDGLSESSGAFMHNNRPEAAIELIIQSGTSSFQIANNGIRSTYPSPNDKASTASAMLARTQQHSNEEDVEKGHSVALYDSHIRTGESIPANEPSIGFMTMNHEEIGKIGVESLKKSDGTSIGKHIVLRNDDMEMPVAVRTSGNRLQYWDEGLDIWQDILPAKMVSSMNEHIQWDFTGGESGDEPIVIHMKGMTFTSKDGFKFTTGALTPDSLSVELKKELRGKSLRLNTSNTVFVYDADNNPFPSGQIIDLTVDVQGISGSIDWNIKGYNIEGAEVSVPTTIINNKHIKINIDSIGNNVQKIVATVSLEDNDEEYTDTLTLLKLKNGLDGDGRGVQSISEWLLSTNKNTGVTKGDLGWTKDGYPEINKSKPYLWKYTSIVYSDETTEETEPALIGAFGIDGRSVSKVESYYAASTRASGVVVDDLTWVKTPVNPTNEQPYLWNYDRIIYTDNVNPTILGPRVIGVHGIDGKDGEKGEAGRGIASTDVSYTGSTSGTSTPSSGWVKTIPTVAAGNYLWTKTVWTYTDGKTETGYSVSRIGKDGNTGKDGIAGKDGVGLTGTTITYAKHTNGTTPPTTGWTDQPPSANDGEFIWTRTIWKYTDGTSETGYSVGKIGATGAKGDTGATGPKGIDGKSISNITDYYLATSASTGITTATTGWSTTIPTLTAINKYLWRYEKINYINPTSSSNTTPVIIGMFSKDGNNGAAGRGISSIENFYKLTNSTVTPVVDSSWETAPLATTTSNRYLWNYEKIVYTNPTGTTNTTPAIISTHGATGAKGDAGATGPQGAKGADGAPGPKGTDGRHGIDLSMGEMVYKDPSFLNGMNEVTRYSTLGESIANLAVTRVASSADNPVVSPYMIEVKTTSRQNPGFGGVCQQVASRKKAVYVHRLIAKIPVGRRLYLDNLGNIEKYTYLTSMDGTGYFEEYLIKIETTPNSNGTLGFFYVDGGATPTETEPLTWYIAYLTTFDLYVGSTLQANHTWIKYGNANGADMSDTPNRLTHIGIATNKFTDIPSKNTSDYSWAVFSASTVPDPIIPDKHVWFKFADNEYGEGMSSNPTGKSWIGIALNKTSVAATSAASDYEWRQIYKVQTSTQPFKPIGAAPGHLWIDTSVSPPVIKKYNGDVWENIADTSELLAEISNKVDSATAQQIAQDMGVTILNEVQATFQSLSSDVNGFSMEFSEYQTLVDSSLSELGVRINETKDYINFIDGKIILGTTQNNFSVEISNEKISFKDGGEEVAYINNQELFINDARVQKKLTFGVESGDKIVGFFVESNGLFLRRM